MSGSETGMVLSGTNEGFYRHLAMTLPSQSQFDSALTKTDLAENLQVSQDPHHWGFVAY